MRVFAYNEQEANNPLLITDKQILEEYYPWWKEQMIKVNKSNLINEDNCIDDWVIINWAWELK